MSVEIIIRSTNLRELIYALASIRLEMLPEKTMICMAVCEDLQAILDNLFDYPYEEISEFTDLFKDHLELQDLFDAFLADVVDYGFCVDGISLADSFGSVIVRAQRLTH